MLKRVITCSALLTLIVACKDDAEKPSQNSTNPNNLTYEQQQINQLQMQNSSYQQQITALQNENLQLRNQISAAGGVLPPTTTVGNTNGLMNPTMIGTLVQVALSALNANKSQQSPCSANAFHSCVQGTTTAIYCNDQGTGFVSRVDTSRCTAAVP